MRQAKDMTPLEKEIMEIRGKLRNPVENYDTTKTEKPPHQLADQRSGHAAAEDRTSHKNHGSNKSEGA